jgi:hypothetical protein
MSQSNKRIHIIGETKGAQPIVDFNGVVIDSQDEEAIKLRTEFWIAKQIGTDLMRTYPNRQWFVDVDCRNQVVVISCPSLSKRMGYRLHMKRDTVADLIPRARRAAGEILERFGVSRGRSIDALAIEAMKRDVRDDVISKDAVAKF